MKKGAPLAARTAAFPDSRFEGRIDEIDSRINTTTRTVRVRAILPNRDGKLKPGMLMTVDVLSNQVPRIAIPELAITELGSDAYVYRASQKGPMTQVEQVFIKPGRRMDGYIEVLEGLSSGDQVIVEGVNRVRPGMPVRLKPVTGEAGEGVAQIPNKADATAMESGGVRRGRN
jgi:membrane fusion protein (multidrug efflux system)